MKLVIRHGRGRDRSRTAVDYTQIGVVYVVFGLPWPVVGEAPGFRGARGRGFGTVRAVSTGQVGQQF